MIKYADDTVIYVSHKNFKVIEQKLSEDMKEIDAWCAENDLILNLEIGKAEAMMFGTKNGV